MTEKRLLILGALEEFVPLVEYASKQGVYCVVVDGNPGAPAKQRALECGGTAYDADIRDYRAVADIAKKENVSAITTAYSDLLLECMVNIAHLADLPCHLEPSQLDFYRNKSFMREMLDILDIPGPGNITLSEGFSDGELSGLTFPCVIKPLDLYGSRGMRIVRNAGQIRSHFHTALKGSRAGRLLVEEYDPDHEFNIQGWVRHGSVHILGLADREKTQVDPEKIPISTRNVYPSRLMSYVYEDAKDILQNYISLSGQTEGPIAMQFYWGPKRGIMVGEIAARFLGYEHELMEYANGFCVEELLTDAAFFDDKIDAFLEKGNVFGERIAAVLYFHARDGVVSDVSAALDIIKRPDVKYGRVFYKEGERVGDPQSQPYAARYYIVCDTREEADALSDEIRAQISIKDKSGRELLYPNEACDYGERPNAI